MKERDVADSDSDESADQKQREGGSGKAATESVSPESKGDGRAGEPPEIRLRSTNEFRGAVATGHRHRKQKAAKERREHGADITAKPGEGE